MKPGLILIQLQPWSSFSAVVWKLGVQLGGSCRQLLITFNRAEKPGVIYICLKITALFAGKIFSSALSQTTALTRAKTENKERHLQLPSPLRFSAAPRAAGRVEAEDTTAPPAGCVQGSSSRGRVHHAGVPGPACPGFWGTLTLLGRFYTSHQKPPWAGAGVQSSFPGRGPLPTSPLNPFDEQPFGASTDAHLCIFS